MGLYRKNPVTVEAFQLTLATRWDNADWPEWANKAWNLQRHDLGALSPHELPKTATGKSSDDLQIVTLEGVHRVTIGDWIIKGVKGELYPCKPEIFDMTYSDASAPVNTMSCAPVPFRRLEQINDDLHAVRRLISKPVNTMSCAHVPFRRLEQINDDLHAVRRLISKPDVVMATPEIMDCVRMSVDRIHDRYGNLACDMRREAQPAGNQAVGEA